MSEFIFVTEKDFSVRAREVIRELARNEPYVLLRVSVHGPRFPILDSAMFVRIVRGREPVESLTAEVSADQRELRGYFPVDTIVAGRVEFGYASHVMGSVTIGELDPERLDPARITQKVGRITSRELGPFRGIRERSPTS